MKLAFLLVLFFVSSPTIAQPPAVAEHPLRFLSRETLESLLHVAKVQFTPAKGIRKRQIIHILDFHFVDEKTHGIDVRDGAKEAGETLTDAEVAADWELFLSEVKAVQAEQMAVLRSLAKSHGLKAVHMEGVTMEGIEGFRRLVGHIRDYKPRGNHPLELLLNEMHQHDTLLIGAPGRLMMTGEIEVLPVEDQKLYEAANPVKDSKVKFDEAAIERREDAIVQNLLASNLPVTVLVLGGTHDLAANLKRASVEDVEYVLIEVQAYFKAEKLE